MIVGHAVSPDDGAVTLHTTFVAPLYHIQVPEPLGRGERLTETMTNYRSPANASVRSMETACRPRLATTTKMQGSHRSLRHSASDIHPGLYLCASGKVCTRSFH